MSESVADVTVVWSAVIWSLDAPDAWSSESVAWALASVASAADTDDCRLAESMVASTWPAVTVSPALTLTAVTVPADEKLRSSVWAAATVPSAETALVSAPRVTVTSCLVVVVVADDAESSERKATNHTASAVTSTTGTTT